jgi:hypothetical protein
MGEALTIEVRSGRGVAIVTLAGEIDIATVPRLRERLLEVAASGRPLVADLDRRRLGTSGQPGSDRAWCVTPGRQAARRTRRPAPGGTDRGGL